MIKQLRMNEDFARPLGPAIPKPAPAAPKSREIKPGIWQAPDGKLRTDFATGQSVAPAQKAAPVAPLPVVPNALGDGWIAWEGGECCPVQSGTAIEVRMREPNHVSGRKGHDFTSYEARHYWQNEGMGNDIVAYRLIP